MNLSRTPSLAGSSGQDSPNLTGWGTAATQESQENHLARKIPLYKRLRLMAEPPQFEEFGVPVEARRTFHIGMGNWILYGAHGFFSSPDYDGHSDPEAFIEQIAVRLSVMSNIYNGKRTESPIEDILLGAMLWINMAWAGFPLNDAEAKGPSAYKPTAEEISRKKTEFLITPQTKIAGHRVDFLLWITCGKAVGGIVIECDGHAFHEKTKEQAARDKRRDRDILAAGYPVMRFSGSEIFNDVHGCIEQIEEVLSDVLDNVSKAGGLF